MKLLKKYSLTIIGVITGAIGGFLYWKYIGCESGTCPITSNPLHSTAYGALMGSLFMNLFKPTTT